MGKKNNWNLILRDSRWALIYSFIIVIASLYQYRPEFFIGFCILIGASLICASIERLWLNDAKKNR